MIHWWTLPRQPGRNGDLAYDKDTGELIPCPSCGSAPIVYNGNYFCDDTEGCFWALSSPARTRADQAVCERIGLRP